MARDFNSLPSGNSVGPYEILTLIGVGGMGEVYGARGPGDRVVALKVLSGPGDDDGVTVRRFEREGRIQRELDHPALVKILDAGQVGGLRYLAMEMVSGGSLTHRIQSEEVFPLEDVWRMAHSLASGLAYLHEKGILHRDLKPGNVLLTESGDVKIADFGLARGDEHTVMTQANQLIGTLAFIPPELFAGESFTGPGDVYSMGLIFYEMLTLEQAVRGAGPAEVLNFIMSERPTPVRQRRPDCPPALAVLLDRMTARRPNERPTAAEVVGELEALKSRGGRPRRTRRNPVSSTRLPVSSTGLPVSDAGALQEIEAPTIALDRSSTGIPLAPPEATEARRPNRAAIGLVGGGLVLLGILALTQGRGGSPPGIPEASSPPLPSAARVPAEPISGSPDSEELPDPRTTVAVEFGPSPSRPTDSRIRPGWAPGSRPRRSKPGQESLRAFLGGKNGRAAASPPSGELDLRVLHEEARAGDGYSRYVLARHLEEGTRMDRDTDAAWIWYALAARSGYRLACERLEDAGRDPDRILADLGSSPPDPRFH